jgi:cell division transport system permease protein
MVMTKDKITGANKSQGVTLSSRFNMLIRLHKIEAKRSIIEILSNPIANLMTVLVIAIALALPAGLQILLDNGKTLSNSWDGASRISLYLKTDLSKQKLASLAETIKKNPAVSQVDMITQDEALDDFKNRSGFADAIAELDHNPLPPVLIIQPSPLHTSPESSEKLLQEFKKITEVDLAKLDLDWVRKLHALLQLAEKVASALGIALAIAVLLIVGNTIRLSVQNRRDEIEVVKLVGATDAFIRRPFLYTGFWYGLIAGIICWLLLTISLAYLKGPIQNLAGLYESQYNLSGLNWKQSLQLIGLSCTLGLLGSWLSVGRHIRQIEPR